MSGTGSLADSGRGGRGRLYDLLASRHAATSDLLSWSRAFRREEGGPLDFELFPFQREIYEAFGDPRLPTVDVRKSAQCGISAAAVSLALYACERWRANVIYVLPTEDLAELFCTTRVQPAIAESPYLRGRCELSSKELVRMGGANLYFVGAVAETKALALPADVLLLDEYDRLDPRQVPKFEKRLGAPGSMKLERRFSNPRFPESGIDDHYLQSDQRTRLERCASCRTEAPLAWAAGDEDAHHVDEERGRRVCARCGRLLEAEHVASGRWVARHPGVAARGYHVSKLIVPTEDVAALVVEHRKADEDSIGAHYNFDLGLPYAPRGGALTRGLVWACRRKYSCPTEYGGRDWVTAGVDVGKVLHVRISRWPESSGKAIPLYIGEVPGFEDLADLWSRYNVNFGLIDERPEERAARSFAEAFAGRAMLVRWSGPAQHDDIVIDEDHALVIARRTWACDQTVDQFTRQVRYLPRNVSEDYIRQLIAPHKLTETSRGGQKESRYTSDERADHFFFAETYDVLAKKARSGVFAGGWSDPPMSIRDEIRARRLMRGS
jgi:hypothetical protein